MTTKKGCKDNSCFDFEITQFAMFPDTPIILRTFLDDLTAGLEMSKSYLFCFS